MSTEHENEGAAEITTVEEARGVSLLREAEQRRDTRGDTLFLDVPTWNGDLIAEYKVIDRQRLNAMVNKIQTMARNGNQSSAATAADVDLILEANVGLYARNPEGGETEEEARVPIERNGQTVTYRQLGPVLGKEFSTAREVVLYAMKNNAVAINDHATNLARWMRDPSKDPTEGLG